MPQKKTTKIAIIYGIRVERKSKVPIYQQVKEQIKKKILTKQLCQGDRLPSIRKLATQLQLSHDTICIAYRELISEGWISAKNRSGYWVESPINIEREVSTASAFAQQPSRQLNEKLKRAAQALEINFAQDIKNRPFSCYSVPDDQAKKQWYSLSYKAIVSGRYHRGYGNPYGYLPLRKVICEKLRQTRGILADPDQIVITSGTIQSLNLCAKLLFQPGDSIVMEDPCHQLFAEIFSFSSIRSIPTDVDKDGLVVENFVKNSCNATGVLVSPSCQYPLSTTFSLARRKRLVSWANQTNGWIIEDDTENIYSGSTEPVQAIYTLPSAAECTVFLYSFSLFLYPGIRLGFILSPPHFAPSFAGAKLLSDRQSTESIQAAVADFLESSLYEQYLRKLIQRCRLNKEILSKMLRDDLDGYGELLPSESGSHITFLMNDKIRDTEVCRRLADIGISVLPVSPFCRKWKRNGIMLGIANFPPSQVKVKGKELVEFIKNISKEARFDHR